jgi:hypothetical protein
MEFAVGKINENIQYMYYGLQNLYVHHNLDFQPSILELHPPNS